MKSHRIAVSVLLAAALTSLTAAAQTSDQLKARDELHRTVRFYRSEVGWQGAYLWRYSADLKHQEGEGTATKTSGWTQPPGAPSVGEAYLKAWRLSGEKICLDAAVETARALVRSQLKSGGWSSHFDLGADGRRRYVYRIDDNTKGSNLTTFDDNKSQSALMLLMHVDEELNFKDAQIHEAVEYALKSMLAAQYPNGAWPQQYQEPPNPSEFPTKKASYPESWPREYPGRRYIGFYTFNDNNMSHIIDMLLEAHRIYDRRECFDAAKKTGDFFLLAQMPDPQPGWAQQYNRDMHPVWARKFEPPAVTGGESQSVMRSLLTLFRHTGERRYVNTIPKALAYYGRSELSDGRLARFYELQTNRPLYFTKDYQLTYSDADMPTHYGFKVGSGLESIQRQYDELIRADADELRPEVRTVKPVRLTGSVRQRADAVRRTLDDRGAWVEQGSMRHQNEPLQVIDMKTFARNLERLAAYVGAR